MDPTTTVICVALVAIIALAAFAVGFYIRGQTETGQKKENSDTFEEDVVLEVNPITIKDSTAVSLNDSELSEEEKTVIEDYRAGKVLDSEVEHAAIVAEETEKRKYAATPEQIERIERINKENEDLQTALYYKELTEQHEVDAIAAPLLEDVENAIVESLNSEREENCDAKNKKLKKGICEKICPSAKKQ